MSTLPRVPQDARAHDSSLSQSPGVRHGARVRDRSPQSRRRSRSWSQGRRPQRRSASQQGDRRRDERRRRSASRGRREARIRTANTYGNGGGSGRRHDWTPHSGRPGGPGRHHQPPVTPPPRTRAGRRESARPNHPSEHAKRPAPARQRQAWGKREEPHTRFWEKQVGEREGLRSCGQGGGGWLGVAALLQNAEVEKGVASLLDDQQYMKKGSEIKRLTKDREDPWRNLILMRAGMCYLESAVCQENKKKSKVAGKYEECAKFFKSFEAFTSGVVLACSKWCQAAVLLKQFHFLTRGITESNLEKIAEAFDIMQQVSSYWSAGKTEYDAWVIKDYSEWQRTLASEEPSAEEMAGPPTKTHLPSAVHSCSVALVLAYAAELLQVEVERLKSQGLVNPLERLETPAPKPDVVN